MSTTMERCYCDRCSGMLEEGQIGLCDSCIEDDEAEATSRTTPVRQLLSDFLDTSPNEEVAGEFILQAILNAAHEVANNPTLPLWEDDGPLKKADWVAAAQDIATRLSAMVLEDA